MNRVIAWMLTNSEQIYEDGDGSFSLTFKGDSASQKNERYELIVKNVEGTTTCAASWDGHGGLISVYIKDEPELFVTIAASEVSEIRKK